MAINQQQTTPTLYQKLSKLFGSGGQPTIDKVPSISAKELLTATSAEELMLKKLEAQQSQYLGNQFEKLSSNLYQQSVYYETTRLASYGDFMAMEFCIAGETKIPTPDGFITIEELAKKGRDYEFITYAYDFNKKCVVPAKARNAHHTRDEMTYKVIFDNDSYIIATLEHRFLKRDGTFEKVKNLKEGDSMMPFYETNDQIYSCNDDIGWINVRDLDEWGEYEKCNLNNKINIPWDNFIDEIESLYKRHETKEFIDIQLSKKFNVNIFDLECFIKQNGYNIWEELLYAYGISNKKLELEPELNHKIKKIEPYKVIPVYDLTVPGYKNFATDTIFSHNTPEISASLDLISEESCLDGNTNIRLLDGTNPTIEELYNKNKRNFWIYSYDTNNNKFIPDKAEKVIYKGIKDVYLVKLDDDTEIKCTNNHKWLGKNNKWTKTSDLYENFSFIGNHRVISIEYVGKEKVYDIVNSGKFNSFGVKCNNGMIISHNCTLNEFGKMLQVFSDSKRVKTILENLFNNTLDINVNLPAWTRNCAKFGDNFLYLKSELGKGIVGVKQLPNIEIKREESSITDQKNIVRFLWQGKSMEFTSWQVAHFRLLGDDTRLPYGTSFLEKVRKIWKQLVLSEDAMLVYRITRSPERRVFKIDVGNLDDKDVEAYIQRVAQKLGKRTPQAENTSNFTSQVDVRFNTLSIDQDIFLPTRAGGGTTEIDTLPGAQNLDQIADIEYIQRKLFTAMRIPKAFLGFEEAIGEGKNLALQDIRFARTINRIQQSMIQELNKIAIIHLFMLGFEDELDNFTLTLNSPSTQAEMLKIEQWKEKILLYRDMVSDAGNGFAATSMTWAKRNILGFSDDEINLDLNQQRIEKAAGKENDAPEQVIHTGLFDNLDKRYQKKEGEETPAGEEDQEGGPGKIPGISGGGEEGPGGPEMGGVPEGGGEMPALPELTEDKVQILENKYKILDDDQSIINEDVKSMLSDINSLLESGEKISIKKIENNKEKEK